MALGKDFYTGGAKWPAKVLRIEGRKDGNKIGTVEYVGNEGVKSHGVLVFPLSSKNKRKSYVSIYV